MALSSCFHDFSSNATSVEKLEQGERVQSMHAIAVHFCACGRHNESSQNRPPSTQAAVPGDAQSLDQSSQRALILVMKPVRAWLFCPPSGQFQPRDLKNCRNWPKGRMRQLPPTPSLSPIHTHVCTCTRVQEGTQAEQGRTHPITAEAGRCPVPRSRTAPYIEGAHLKAVV